MLQMLELAGFVHCRSCASPTPRTVVLAGDLNAAPDTLEMRLLQVRLGRRRQEAWAGARRARSATANHTRCTRAIGPAARAG